MVCTIFPRQAVLQPGTGQASSSKMGQAWEGDAPAEPRGKLRLQRVIRLSRSLALPDGNARAHDPEDITRLSKGLWLLHLTNTAVGGGC
jgi:hypothetical protein